MGRSRARITHTEGMGRPNAVPVLFIPPFADISQVTAASGLFEPKKTGSIQVKWLRQAHFWATLSSAKLAPGRPQAKASGHRFRFFFAIRRPKPPVSSSSMSRRAYEQFMGLETEMRESGTTYSCPQGNTKI